MFITRLQYNSSIDFAADVEYMDQLAEIYGKDSSMYTSTARYEMYGAADTLCTTAFVFFDFQKALFEDTHIATMMNIDNIVAHFGIDFVYSQLRYDIATASRYGADNTLYRTISSRWTDPEGDMLGDSGQVPAVQVDTNTQELEGFAEHTVDYGINGSANARSRFIPRAIQELGSGGKLDINRYDNYAMAFFELYDYQLMDTVSDNEWYQFTVVMQDYTLNTINTLSSSYADVLTGSFKEYYDIAHEVCYYNTVDDTFNDFFVTGITQMFPVESTAPWNLAPVIYNIHRDILTNEFEGSMEDILNDSSEIAAKINPETGTLQQLRGFYTNFQALWDYFYEVDGHIWTQIYLDAEHGVMRLLPGFESPQELTYNNISTELPEMRVVSDIFALSAAGNKTYIMSAWTDRAEAEGITAETIADGHYGSSDITADGVYDYIIELSTELKKFQVYSDHTYWGVSLEMDGDDLWSNALWGISQTWEDMFYMASDTESKIDNYYRTFAADGMGASTSVSGYVEYEGAQYFSAEASAKMMEMGVIWMELIKLIWPNDTTNGGASTFA